MKIRFLGTGGGRPHPERMTSSTLIEGPEGALLLDAGEGSARRLVHPGYWTQDVRSILITHRHVDHLSGLPLLLSMYKNTKRTTPLEIHVHHDLMQPLRQWIDALKVGNEHQTCDLIWCELEQGQFSPASGHDGFIWRNDHLPPSDMGGCYSLALTVDGDRWVFSGDLETFDSVLPYLDDTQVLVLESRHIDVEDGVKRALQAGVDRVILTHVGPELEPWPMDGAMWAQDNWTIDTKSFLKEGD